MKRPRESVDQSGAPLADDAERRVLSRKELAREHRRAVYQRAKQWRASDPRQLALKEAAKQRQRATYQKVKAQRKAKAEAKKEKQRAERARERSDQRKEHERELMTLVTCTAKGSTAQN